MMRQIKYIVVHSTQTPPQAAINVAREITLAEKAPRFHYLVQRDGEVSKLVDERKVAQGLFGHDQKSIHIAYVGGVDREGKPVDNRTTAQKDALFDTIISLTEKYPQAEILGQEDFPNGKEGNPSFDVKTWMREYTPDLGIAA